MQDVSGLRAEEADRGARSRRRDRLPRDDYAMHYRSDALGRRKLLGESWSTHEGGANNTSSRRRRNICVLSVALVCSNLLIGAVSHRIWFCHFIQR